MHTLESNADRSRERVQPTDRPIDRLFRCGAQVARIHHGQKIHQGYWVDIFVCRVPFADRIPRPGRSIGKSSKRNLPLPLPVVVVFEYQRREEKERGRGEAWFTTHEWTSSSTGASLSLYFFAVLLSVPFHSEFRCKWGAYTHTHTGERASSRCFVTMSGIRKKERIDQPTAMRGRSSC